jgi:signal peptidase I
MSTRQAVGSRHRAGRVRRQRGGRRRRIKPIKLSREIPMLIVLALGLSLLIKTFLVQAFYIPSPSMENTLEPGDRVLVNKFSPWFGWQPQRGEIVVFKDPDNWLGTTPPAHENPVLGGLKDVLVFIGLLPSDDQRDLIKRVIGVPGDKVACCDAHGRVTVNGVPLKETSYLRPGSAPSLQTFAVTVPPGRLWVMGDNRGNSADSRYHMNDPGDGTVPISDVVGHAFVLIWPLNRMTGLGIPSTFDQSALRASSALGAPLVPAAPALVLVPFVCLTRRRSRRPCRQLTSRRVIGRPRGRRPTPRQSWTRRRGRPHGRPMRLSAAIRAALPVRFGTGQPSARGIEVSRRDARVGHRARRVRSTLVRTRRFRDEHGKRRDRATCLVAARCLTYRQRRGS